MCPIIAANLSKCDYTNSIATNVLRYSNISVEQLKNLCKIYISPLRYIFFCSISFTYPPCFI